MRITEYDVGAGAYGVAIARDGAVWTTLVERGELARVAPDGTVSHVRLDAGDCRPMVLAHGPDAALWFSRGDGLLGRVAPDGDVSSRPTLTAEGAPYGLCAGPGRALWYTLLGGADRIGRIAEDGRHDEFGVPPGSMPSIICPGPADTLWVTLNQANAIARVTADGTITTRGLPTADAGPVGIDANRDAAWFAEINAGQVGRIAADGTIAEFPLPDRTSRPHAVAVTADGGCWVTLWAANSAVRLSPEGEVTAEARFRPGAEPHGLAIAADASLWVALETGILAHIEDLPVPAARP